MPKLRSLKVPIFRPDDYFAEMAKTDGHMHKVFHNCRASDFSTFSNLSNIFRFVADYWTFKRRSRDRRLSVDFERKRNSREVCSNSRKRRSIRTSERSRMLSRNIAKG
jgi:hypothetical protein